MSEKAIGTLEFELEFPPNRNLKDVRNKILIWMEMKRKEDGIQYYVSRITDKKGRLTFRLKGEKVTKQSDGHSERTEQFPTRYTSLICIPVDSNLYEEIEKERNQLESKFGDEYKTIVLYPIIYTQGDTDILVVLLCKKK